MVIQPMTAPSVASEQSIILLTELNQSNVRFAHWKGNSHLLESLEGKTDIELLIYPEDRQIFESVMNTLGYKKLQNQVWNSYPQVEDWIGFDYESGNLLHLHTHYALVVAIRYGKHLCLPWTDEFFRHLIIDEQTKWPIPEPELESVILLIRICVKVKASAYKEQAILISKQQELVGLLRKGTTANLCSICLELGLKVPHDMDERTMRILQQASLDEVKELAEYFYNQLSANKEATRFFSSLKFLYYKYYLKIIRYNFVFTGLIQQKKTILNGGKVFALIGSDGSGKSSLSNDLTEWLTFKIDTHYFYMGKKPFIRSYNKQLFSKADLLANRNTVSRLLKKLLGDIYYVIMIKQKADMLRLAKKMSRQGSIVICDRFPQKDMMEINDGPKLQKDKNNWPSKVEMNLFNQVTSTGADTVFRLNVSPEVAHKRKPEHDFSIIKQKCENINNIYYSNSTMIDLDADQPYDQVLLTIKRELWKNL